MSAASDSDNHQMDGSGGTGDSGMFARVAQEVLDAAERVTNNMEHGIQAFFAGSTAPQATEGLPQEMNDQQEFGDDETMMQFSQQDFEKMVREQIEGSPLQGMAEQVVGGIMQGQSGPQTLSENISAFRHAVNWTEPLVLGIMAFQVVMFLLTLWVSRRGRSMEARLVVMVCIAAIVRSAQRVNSYAAQRWERIATQNYFDEGGIFMTVLMCTPLLVDCFIMLVCFLREAATLLVQVKTAEIKKRKKQDKAAKKKDD